MREWVGVSLRYSRRITLVIFLAFSFIFSQAIVAGPASASPPCSITGNGSSSTPWQVQSSADLVCFETGVWNPPGGQVGYLSLQTDVVKTNDVKLFSNSPVFSIRFNGNGNQITIDGVSNFQGLFRDSRDSTFENFTVVSINGSSLKRPLSGASGYGWVIENDYSGLYKNIVVTAPISDQNGGIIGGSYGSYVFDCISTGSIGSVGAGGLVQSTMNESGASPQTRQTLIRGSHSTGFIGGSSGGILGIVHSPTKISTSYSTGQIDNSGAGGIVGTSVAELIIESSFSTGNIGFNSGGILGQYSSSFHISNSYSEGDISPYGGGFVGMLAQDGVVENSYSLGAISDHAGGIFGGLYDDGANYPGLPGLTALNVYVAGQIVGSGGGVASPGPNAVGSGLISTQSLTVTYTNAYFDNFASPGWSDTDAATALIGFQGWGGSYKWIQCSVNIPAFITAMYQNDPCNPSPSPTPAPTEASELANTGITLDNYFQLIAFSLAMGVIVLLIVKLIRRRDCSKPI